MYETGTIWYPLQLIKIIRRYNKYVRDTTLTTTHLVWNNVQILEKQLLVVLQRATARAFLEACALSAANWAFRCLGH